MKDKREQSAAIRELNDRFRTTGVGNGRILMTSGVQALGDEFVAAALAAVQAFDAFDPGNDPWGEHDFGSFVLMEEKVFWKFDYYDVALRDHSPDASDDSVTRRVLTIMLAGEY